MKNKAKGVVSVLDPNQDGMNIILDHIKNAEISDARMIRAVKTNYDKLLENNFYFCKEIYKFLLVITTEMPENQIELFKYSHCLMKHYSSFDESIILTKVMIKDNQRVLKSLTNNFFGSLRLLLDSLSKEDPKRIMKIDLVIKDPNHNLFSD